MTTFRRACRRRVNIMTNTPRFCINRRQPTTTNAPRRPLCRANSAACTARCISRIQLSQAQRGRSVMYKEKNSNKFSTAHADFINLKNCPRHSLCAVKFLLSIYKSKKKIPEGCGEKNDARVIVCFQAPPMDQRYLKGRRGIFVGGKRIRGMQV
jgi:hypothetical protein